MSDENANAHPLLLAEPVVLYGGAVFSLLHIYFNTYGLWSTISQNGVHFAGFAVLCSLVFPLMRGGPSWIAWADLAFGLLVAWATMHVVTAENAIYDRGVRLEPIDWIAGTIVILGALEYSRRVAGLIIPLLIILSLSYLVLWGPVVPGVFRFAGLSAESVLFRSLYTDEGMLGNIAYISSTFVFMFILFGAFLVRSGAGEFIVDLARAMAGRLTGGPGFVAVIASCLTGTISGSAVANAASTGVITIPLMKRAGFPARFAGGVEAASSTGGQLMPPIMGAGAFAMASLTQISYTTIAAVSLIPALLYFITVALNVRIEARRNHVTRTATEDTQTVSEVMAQGGLTFLLPIIALIGMLITGFSPIFAACVGIGSVVAASWLGPRPMGPQAILEALSLGARNMVLTAILLCAVGLMVNVIATAGIGPTFSQMITVWAGDSLLFAIALIALASLILGMGLPVTAAYIVLATLSAPALRDLIVDGEVIRLFMAGEIAPAVLPIIMLGAPDQAALLGMPMDQATARAVWDAVPIDLKAVVRAQMVPSELLTAALLTAHLIIFWLSQDSNVTPPVCLAAFTAAAIAKSPPMMTGVEAWRVSKGLYIVPLLMAYTPLIGGSFIEVAIVVGFGVLGLYAFTGAVAGHLEDPLSWPLRAAAAAAAILLLCPVGLSWHVGGAVVLAGVMALSMRRARLRADATPPDNRHHRTVEPDPAHDNTP